MLLRGRPTSDGVVHGRSAWCATTTAGGTCCGPPPSTATTVPTPRLKYQTTEQDGPAGRRPAHDHGRDPPARRPPGAGLPRPGDRPAPPAAPVRPSTAPPPGSVGFTALVIDPTTARPAAARADGRPGARVGGSRQPVVARPGPARLAEGYARVGRVPAGRRGAGRSTATGSTTCRCSSVRARLDRTRPGASRGAGDRWGRPPAGATPGPGARWCCGRRGETVFTVVSDAPLDQVLTAARDLPVPASRRPSVLERLRSMARTLIQPLE